MELIKKRKTRKERHWEDKSISLHYSWVKLTILGLPLVNYWEAKTIDLTDKLLWF
jgi:hypothetical protein